MKHWFEMFLMCVLLVCGCVFVVLGPARSLYAGEPNEPCVQVYYDPPAGLDPNVVVGILLCPDPNAPTDYNVPSGKFFREARACDPNNDDFDVEFIDGTTPATVDYNDATGLWSLAAEVVPGLNLWMVRATDTPQYATPKSNEYTVVAFGEERANKGPVLE